MRPILVARELDIPEGGKLFLKKLLITINSIFLKVISEN